MTTAYTADQVIATKPEFIWPVEKPGQQGGVLDGRIMKGALHFIAGRPDRGKGLAAVRIGADVILSGSHVLHSAMEDSPGRITKPRYMACGVKGDHLKRLHLKRFRFPDQFNEWTQYVLEHDIKLCVFDPVASHMSHGVNRFNDSIRAVTDPMSAFCEKHNVSVLWIEHVNKNTRSDDPLSAIGGSGSGLVASSRMGFLLGIDPDTDGDRILCHIKGNEVERRAAMRFEIDVTPVEVIMNTIDPDTEEVVTITEEEDFPALLFTEECIFDPMRLIKPEKKDGENRIGRPNDKRQAAAEWLTNYLFNAHQKGLQATADFLAVPAGQGVPAGRVFEDAKLAGMTEKTLRRAKTEMGVEIRPVGGGRNAKWNLPSEIIDLLTGGDDEPAENAQDAAEGDESAWTVPDPDQGMTDGAALQAIAAEGLGLDPDSDEFDSELAALLGTEPDADDQADEDGAL